MAFPRGFLWGAGTAAHQVEGGNYLNDWWAWEADPDSHCVEASGDACDHWNRYSADLDLLAALGLRAYRFSIEWSRVEPREGDFSVPALDHYREVCRAARARGIEPIVTFHHFTTPAWLAAAGGWSNPGRRLSTLRDSARSRPDTWPAASSSPARSTSRTCWPASATR
jgi:beta-glucosidase